MRILVVTQYYRPELGATPNRLGTFVDGLVAARHEVDVVCEQPNHPAGIFAAGFGRRPVYVDQENGALVRRLWVPASPNKTKGRRLAFYGTFAGIAAAATLALPRPDVVFASSPPLPGALAVAAASKVRRLPLVLDVRDLWPAAAEALGELSNLPLLRLFEHAERWAYRSAARVTATTQPFCAHIDSLAGPGKAVHLPNGAMDELLYIPIPRRNGNHAFTVGYAGNFGIAQGLDVVLEAAAELGDMSTRFLLIGDGPAKQEFLADRDRRGLSERIEVRPALPLAELAPILAECDALLVPLRDSEVLRDFIPSKLYDAMALGRPAIAAAAGEPHRLVQATGCGLTTRPEDGPGLAAAVRRLMSDSASAAAMGRAGREAARELVRSRQVERLEATLLEAAESANVRHSRRI